MLVASALAVVAAAASFSPLPLERIQGEPPLAGRAPVQAKLSPGGKFVTYLKASATSQEVLDLWAQPLPAGEPFALVTASALLGGAEQKLTEAEKMALERKRISQRGITGYGWCGDDDTKLLFPFSGDLYLAELGGSAPKVTRLTTDDGVPEQNPVCTRNGDAVAFVKGGNVVVHEFKAGRAKALTKGASETRFFGLAEFIAEEELDRHEGFWWSPDGTKLLVLEVDESRVGIKVRPQIFADRTEMVSQRYPAAGETNAVVTAHVIDRKTGARTTVKLPPKTTHPVEYIARAGFLGDGTPYLQGLSRDQTALWFFVVDKTGKATALFEEKDADWVDVHSDLRSLDDGALLWSTEQSGRNQLVRIDRQTGARTPLTTQPEAVADVVCAKDGRVVFAGFADRGRSLHLFERATDGAVRVLTSGQASHMATADGACGRLLVTRSTWGVPPTTSLVEIASGKTLLTLGAPGDAPDPLLAASMVGAPRFVDVMAADGRTMLNGLWLPPAPTKGPRAKGSVPVIVHAYGGPTGQVVAHRWARMTPLFTHWQQQGFGVFLVDTRGMAGRDRDFTRAHKNAFGTVELDDVKAAARQLPTIAPEVDANRIGFFGWSYGGYVAAGVMLDDKTPFAAAVGVAPVTDWRLYDTAYTERYIGLPGKNGDAPAYATSNLVTRAKALSKPLLLVHGTADDNVLFEHTLRLVQALEDEGRVFDLAIYPGKAHGIAGSRAQLHLHKTITAFFVEKLRP
jgi:dipeptidyl-peptidase-4